MKKTLIFLLFLGYNATFGQHLTVDDMLALQVQNLPQKTIFLQNKGFVLLSNPKQGMDYSWNYKYNSKERIDYLDGSKHSYDKIDYNCTNSELQKEWLNYAFNNSIEPELTIGSASNYNVNYKGKKFSIGVSSNPAESLYLFYIMELSYSKK